MKKAMTKAEMLNGLKYKLEAPMNENVSTGKSKKKRRNKNKNKSNGVQPTPAAISGKRSQPSPEPSPKLPTKKSKMDNNVQIEVKKLDRNLEKDTLLSNALNQSSESDMACENPISLSTAFISEMLAPLECNDFFKTYFQKKMFFSANPGERSFSQLFCSEDIDGILTHNRVMFSEHLDVARYVDGMRETLNPDGRAFRAAVWDFYNIGCSIRLLCPQVFHPPLQKLLSYLQEFFGCFVGVNAYLTPPDSQGFAPHWDDIEAFILQVEGQKRWRVYKPRNSNEELPRYSSKNLSEDDLDEPIFDKVLSPGDVLYFPRGYIHQACTPEENEEHSLHITISCYQKFTWVDMLQKLMPLALDQAGAAHKSLREGLPLRMLNHLGGAHLRAPSASDRSLESRSCEKTVRQTLAKQLELLRDIILNPEDPVGKAIIHDTADRMAADLVQESLPPLTTFIDHARNDAIESLCDVLEDVECDASNGLGTVNLNALPYTDDSEDDNDDTELQPDDKIRLLRWSCVRSVGDGEAKEKEEQESDEESEDEEEEDGPTIQIFHAMSNTTTYKQQEPQHLRLPLEHLPVWDHLVRSYPEAVSIESLPMESLDEKMSLASGLFENGLIAVERKDRLFVNPESDEEEEEEDEFSDDESYDFDDLMAGGSSDEEEEEDSAGEEMFELEDTESEDEEVEELEEKVIPKGAAVVYDVPKAKRNNKKKNKKNRH